MTELDIKYLVLAIVATTWVIWSLWPKRVVRLFVAGDSVRTKNGHGCGVVTGDEIGGFANVRLDKFPGSVLSFRVGNLELVPKPEARQALRFSEELFVGWFSEGMQWRAGDARCRIVAGIPPDAVLTGAYFDASTRELVILMRSDSTEVGPIDVRFMLMKAGLFAGAAERN